MSYSEVFLVKKYIKYKLSTPISLTTPFWDVTEIAVWVKQFDIYREYSLRFFLGPFKIVPLLYYATLLAWSCIVLLTLFWCFPCYSITDNNRSIENYFMMDVPSCGSNGLQTYKIRRKFNLIYLFNVTRDVKLSQYI